MNALLDLGGWTKCVTSFETFIKIFFAIVLVIFAIFYMFGHTCDYVTTKLWLFFFFMLSRGKPLNLVFIQERPYMSH